MVGIFQVHFFSFWQHRVPISIGLTVVTVASSRRFFGDISWFFAHVVYEPANQLPNGVFFSAAYSVVFVFFSLFGLQGIPNSRRSKKKKKTSFVNGPTGDHRTRAKIQDVPPKNDVEHFAYYAENTCDMRSRHVIAYSFSMGSTFDEKYIRLDVGPTQSVLPILGRFL